MNIRPIHTDADYRVTLAEVSRLVDLDPPLGSPDGDKLEILAILLEAYEAVQYPASLPDPVEAIQSIMESQGLRPIDMTAYFGSASKASEVLNRSRRLSLAMIRKLHQGLGIPLAILIQDSRLTRSHS
jgi:HTH-type transcriptional regulator / antitoxin HigA